MDSQARTQSDRRFRLSKWLSLCSLFVAAVFALGASAGTKSETTAQTNKGTVGNAQNGKLVFEKAGCNLCHGSQGEGVAGAASNRGVPRIAATALLLTDFVQQVRKPKGQMPPFGSEKVSDAELADIYAYLQSVKPGTEQRPAAAGSSKGEQLYKNYGCYECHGYQGQGSVSTGGARLAPPRIPLSAFVGYLRQPTGEMPPYARKVVSDEDADEIYNFLKSVPSPPPLKSIPLLNH